MRNVGNKVLTQSFQPSEFGHVVDDNHRSSERGTRSAGDVNRQDFLGGSVPVDHLAVWFGLHVMLPETGGVDYFAIVVCVVAFIGMVKWKWGIIPVILGAGALGLGWRMMGH